LINSKIEVDSSLPLEASALLGGVGGFDFRTILKQYYSFIIHAYYSIRKCVCSKSVVPSFAIKIYCAEALLRDLQGVCVFKINECNSERSKSCSSSRREINSEKSSSTHTAIAGQK